MNYKKIIISILFLLLFISPNSYSQQTKGIEDFLEKNYKHDKKEFYKKIYTTIKFPGQARENCAIGRLYTRLNIDKDGWIKEIQFLNAIGNGLEYEVEKAVKPLSNDWTTIDSDSIRVLDFVVAWNVETDSLIKGDINVIAYGGFPCESTESYLKRLKKSMKKKRYKQAKYITEELVLRDPYSNKYRQLDKVVSELIKK